MNTSKMLIVLNSVLDELNERAGDTPPYIDAVQAVKWAIEHVEDIRDDEEEQESIARANFERDWQGGDKP